MVEAKTSTIKSLDICQSLWSMDRVRAAYKVVAFIVKVRLVENRVKSTVGMVMVVNVMIQSSTAGMSLAVATTA